MTLEDLAVLVARMRAAQANYFHIRTSDALAEAMKLECQVDAAVLAILNPPQQGDLFGGAPPDGPYREGR